MGLKMVTMGENNTVSRETLGSGKHPTKSTVGTKRKVTKRTRGWTTLLYPESMPENVFDTMAAMGINIAVSPLHDSDTKEDGTPKKPHYHVVFYFSQPKSNLQVEDICASIGSVGCESVNDVSSMVQYLWHGNAPEKHQYNRADCRTFGGFDIDKWAHEKTSAPDATRLIMRIISEKNIRYFDTLCDVLSEMSLTGEMGVDNSVFMQASRNAFLWVHYLDARRHTNNNK